MTELTTRWFHVKLTGDFTGTHEEQCADLADCIRDGYGFPENLDVEVTMPPTAASIVQRIRMIDAKGSC